MKFTKMSLVAALLIGSSAFALENVKVSGDAKLFYSTSDETTTTVADGKTGGLFDAQSSAGQAALGLGVTADLAQGISSGAHLTVLTTLGLQGQLVGNVWEGTNGLSDSYIMDEAWVAATVGKTTAKVGRMELDTPLVFTEKWSIAKNTFEAAVLINQDIPDTTLVAAYVGGSNGQSVDGNNTLGVATGSRTATGLAHVVATNASETTFSQFYKGAFAVAAINNSFKPLTAQAWYFNASTEEVVSATNVLNGVEAYWLQADLACEKIPGLMAGVQYTDLDLQTQLAKVSTDAYAVMLGFEMKDMFTAKVAYSEVDKKHSAAFNLAGTGKSKLYTEAWWNYGKITQADTKSWNVTVESPVNGLFDLGLYYTNANQNARTADNDMTEVAVTASKSFGPLDATLALVNSDVKTATPNDDETTNMVQAYLTLNF